MIPILRFYCGTDFNRSQISHIENIAKRNEFIRELVVFSTIFIAFRNIYSISSNLRTLCIYSIYSALGIYSITGCAYVYIYLSILSIVSIVSSEYLVSEVFTVLLVSMHSIFSSICSSLSIFIFILTFFLLIPVVPSSSFRSSYMLRYLKAVLDSTCLSV